MDGTKKIKEDKSPTPVRRRYCSGGCDGGGCCMGYTVRPAIRLAENVFKDNKSAPKQLITSRLFVCVASQKFWPRENGTARNKSKYSHTHTHTHPHPRYNIYTLYVCVCMYTSEFINEYIYI